jgi:Fic family protein
MAFTIEDLKEHLLIGSTLVEGSTLTENEARSVFAGRTVQGHPVREIRELTNYQNATEWLMAELAQNPYLSVDMLLDYHARLMTGLTEDAGRFKAFANHTLRTDGTRYDYTHPSRVPEEIANWVNAFNQPSNDPVTQGASLSARFEAIHPFSDGNGRIGRVLLAYYLYRGSGMSFRFHATDKLEHLRAIEASNEGDMSLLVEFVRARLKS